MGKENKFNLAFGLSDGSKLEAQFTANDGDNALEIYQSLPGNADKTMDDFQAYLKGIDGNGVKAVTLTEELPPLPRGPFYKLAEPITTPVGWESSKATLEIKLKRIAGEFDMENIDEEKNIIKAFQLSVNKDVPEFQGAITKMTPVEGEDGVYTATLTFQTVPNASLTGEEYTQRLVFLANDTKFKPFDAIEIEVPVKPEFTYAMPPFPLKESRVSRFPGFDFISQREQFSTKNYPSSQADMYTFTGRTAFNVLDIQVVDINNKDDGVMVYHQSLEDANTGTVHGSLNFINEVVTKGQDFEVDHAFEDVNFERTGLNIRTLGNKVKINITGIVTDNEGNRVANVPTYVDVSGERDTAHNFRLVNGLVFFSNASTEGDNFDVTFEADRCVSTDYAIAAAFKHVFGNDDDMGQSKHDVAVNYTQQFKVETAEFTEADYVFSGTVTLKYEEANAAGFAEATVGLLGNDPVPFTLEPIPVTDVYALETNSDFTKCGDFGDGSVRILNLKQFIKA